MKLTFLAGLLLVGGSIAAQNPNATIAPIGAVQTENGMIISQPSSAIEVDLTVSREVVQPGIYARYAQKYLGASAPLTDKTTWSITDAAVALAGEQTPTTLPLCPAPQSAQTMIPIDKTGTAVQSLENAAAQAAATIFNLRRSRMDLITGEAGENVYGGGLKAALDEIARQEAEYTALFLGTRTVTTEIRHFTVYPTADKKQYVVCRFSVADGLLPDTDLSGDMVLLQIAPSGNTAVDCEASPKESSTVSCRVADPCTCAVSVAGREYVRATLPLFAFGRTIQVAAPKKK